MKTWEELENLFKNSFIQAVFSNPSKKGPEIPYKITSRPVKLKSGFFIQNTFHYRDHVVHENQTLNEWKGIDFLKNNYRQGIFQTAEATYQILVSKSGALKILKKPIAKQPVSFAHNRQKNYLLREGEPISFLIELGIMNADGRVLPEKRDKFRQINRFLEMVQDVIGELENKDKIEILDFGCGKAYLTFALYHYFENVLHKSVQILGLDLKQAVIEHCQELAERLSYQHLRFEVGEIGYFRDMTPDMVVCLHACDTATDAALAKAVKWNTKVILAVPCCQHEFFSQIHQADLEPLLRHGILKERFAALATDAARAELLEIHGYHVQVLEFIDMEHTPKNLLIRAVKRGKHKSSVHYERFKQTLHFHSSLEKFLTGNRNRRYTQINADGN